MNCPHCGAPAAVPDLTLDHDAHDVIVNGSRRHLSPVAWKILMHLREQQGFAKYEAIAHAVWGHKVAQTAVATRIGEIRAALSRSPFQIMSRTHIGYRLVKGA